MQTITKKSIIAFYLEFVNNFLTVKRMADYYDMPVDDCLYLIELGKRYNEIGDKLVLSDTMKEIDVDRKNILTGPY